MNTQRKIGVVAAGAAGAFALALSGVAQASAAPFDGVAITSGHYDVTIELESCVPAGDGTWVPEDWEIVIEDHDTHLVAGEDDFFQFNRTSIGGTFSGPTLGFAVEFQEAPSCVDDDGNPKDGVDEFIFEVHNDNGDVVTDPAGWIVLDGTETPEPYHKDVTWNFPNGTGDFLSEVTAVTDDGSDLGSTTIAIRAEQMMTIW